MLDYLKAKWPDVTFTSHTTKPWASVTFSGTRHRFACTMPNTSDFLTEVTDHDFALPGQLVADVEVSSTETDLVGGYTQATIEILTLKDD